MSDKLATVCVLSALIRGRNLSTGTSTTCFIYTHFISYRYKKKVTLFILTSMFLSQIFSFLTTKHITTKLNEEEKQIDIIFLGFESVTRTNDNFWRCCYFLCLPFVLFDDLLSCFLDIFVVRN